MACYSYRTIFIVLFLSSSVLAFQPPETKNDIAAKAFSASELYISSSVVPLQSTDLLTSRPAVERFLSRYGSATTVFIDPRSGTAANLITSIPMIPDQQNQLTLSDISRSLGRPVQKVDEAVVAELFRRFIAENQDVYGIDSRQIANVKATQINDFLWHLHAPQQFHGIPVRRGRVLGVINHGNLVISGAEYWGSINLDTTPLISSTSALKKAFDFVGGQSSRDRIWKNLQLEVIPFSPAKFMKGEGFDGAIGSGYGHRLVWTFGFSRAPELARWEMGVDAHTGEVLFLNDWNYYIDKKIQGGVYPLTNTGVCPTDPTCGVMQPDTPMPWADTGLQPPNDFTNSAGVFNFETFGQVTTTLSGPYVHMNDGCGSISESATGTVNLGGVNLDTDCTTGGTSAGNTPASRSGFYELNKIAETARGYLPNNTWLQSQLTANMNIPQTCNAFWDGSTVNFYLSGGGCRNTGEIAAVFDHEWGHGLDQNDSNGQLSDSSEGYADIASMYRLWASCVGYGFFQTFDQNCGLTSDGTGFNNDENQVGPSQHCDTDCNGVRDSDWMKHFDQQPDDVNFICTSCQGPCCEGSAVPFQNAGPCGRQTHCAATAERQTAWDFAARDLPSAGFDANTSFIIADKLFYQGSGNIGLWHNCTCPSSSDGCGATNAYMQWLAADDDNGNLSDGTPHMQALYDAFNRHQMACGSPTPQNGGCSGSPAEAPVVTVEAKHNQNVLTWNAIAGASNYFVYRGEGYAGCNFGKALIATVPDLTYTDNDVGNGRTYSYVVLAVGSSTSCFGPASTCVQATPVPCAGVPEFTRGIYNCNDTLTIQLLDSDLAGNNTQDVTVSSNTEPSGETVTLTATAPGSDLFSGTINTTANPPAPDGLLSVTHGDTVTASYNDISACGSPATTIADADVDCVAPVISNVAASNINEQSAVITWNTDEPANSRVTYDLAPGPPASVVEDLTTFDVNHSLNLTGLVQCSDYVYSVTSADPAQNSTTDDNGGNFHTFTTTGVGTLIEDDVENGGSNWVATGPPDAMWHVSTCDAYSGTHSFKAGQVDCFQNYGDNAFSTLTNANPFPLGQAGHGYHLTFKENYSIEAPFDFARIQASTDGGASWITIDQYNGINGGWAAKDYDLSNIGGAQVFIRFVLETDANTSSGFGWYIDDIKIERVTPCAGALVFFDSADVDDCSDGGPGDGDGVLDPGESANLTVTAENVGLLGVTGISAVLSTTTPGITITQNSTTFPDIPATSFAAANSPFSFDIDFSVPCISQIDFTITYTANEGTWTDTFSLNVGGGAPFTALSEDFEAGIPASWTVVDGGTDGGAAATWTTDNPGNRSIASPFAGKFAIVDSDNAGPFATQDEQLITPAIDASTCSQLFLDYSNQFHFWAEGPIEVADVDVSTDGGTNWTNVLTSPQFDDGYPTPNTKSLDLSSLAAFQPDVRVRFHYYNANADFWWAIDNVHVTCVPRVCHNCGTGCLFCDQFNDGTLPTDWTFKPVSGAWSENGTAMVGTSSKKAFAIAQPAFSGCDQCFVEAPMQNAGGRLWLFGWYVDKRNTMELVMKEAEDRWILKQRVGGAVVKKAKALQTINPNQSYVARIDYDGTTFTVLIDGVQIISMTPAATVPVGTVGFKVKSTTGTFDSINVN